MTSGFRSKRRRCVVEFQAGQLASEAFAIYGKCSGSVKAAFLRKIADNIEQLGDTLVNRAVAETALPAARIKNEIGRTCGQLRLFAQLVEEGSWVDARVDTVVTRQITPTEGTLTDKLLL